MEPLCEPQFARVPPFRPAPDDAERARRGRGAAEGRAAGDRRGRRRARLAARRPSSLRSPRRCRSRSRPRSTARTRSRARIKLSVGVVRLLFAREREPRGEPRRSRLLHRQRDRRHDHAFLGGAEDRHAGDPDRHRSGSARAQLSAGRDGQRRRQGDARRDAESRGSRAPRHSATPWIAEAEGICRDWYAKYNALLTSDQVPIHPARMCGDLTRHVPDDAIVIVDTGHAGMWMGGMYDLRTPTQSYMRSAGHLGWAFCAGIGAKAACPRAPGRGVHRRRGLLVPHRRDRDRGALEAQQRDGGEQQWRRQPEQARLRPRLWRQADRAGARVVDLHAR